jgi:hypothetical protein
LGAEFENHIEPASESGGEFELGAEFETHAALASD